MIKRFLPVVRNESVRMVIALSASRNLLIHQMDVSTAFLNGNLKEEVYMNQPEGFKEGNMVCKLKKSLYGLKQAPRCWNITLDQHLKEMGLIQSKADPCIYTSKEGELTILAVYVDDIIIATETTERLNFLKTCLADKFGVKDLGEIHSFLGIQIKQDSKAIWIGQPGYLARVLETFGMTNAKPVSTPIDAGMKLQTESPVSNRPVDTLLYQSAVGSLQYLSNWTRPDITYAVNKAAQYSANPQKEHWIAIKRIMRYLIGTKDHGMSYRKGSEEGLSGYCDADWAGDTSDRKSTSGYVFNLAGSPISWRSQKQSCIALSTAEAEYVALSLAAQETVWLRRLMEELNQDVTNPTIIFDDSQSATALAKNPQFHRKTKHIDIRYHFIRDQVEKGFVTIKYCASADMLADILTKGLQRLTHDKLSEKLNTTMS